jgi:hypothetical protein
MNRTSIQPEYRRNTSFRRLQLALALLMARISANHTHNAIATNDLAVAANLFYRCQHFHF